MSSVEVKSSICQAEIDELDKSADIWWEDNGMIRALRNMNDTKNELIINSLIEMGTLIKENVDKEQPLRGLKILDAGCGGGLCTETLVKLGADVVGIDPSEKMIDVAKNHAKLDSSLENLQYIVTTVEEYAKTQAEQFDIVISGEVLEHITEYDIYLEGCIKCLKPGGSIFISTFNRTFLGRFVGIWLVENVFKIVPKGVHDYEKFISPESVTEILKKYGAKTLEVKGLFCNPFSLYWYTYSILKSIHYYLHAVKE